MRRNLIHLAGAVGALTAAGLLAIPANAQPGPHGRPPGAEMFKQADKNNNGLLSYEELTAVRPGMPKDAFERMDGDGDGTLSPDELQGGRDRHFDLMRNADTNGDRKVTREEWDAAKPADVPADAFDRMDRNGDGVLSSDDRGGDERGRPGGPGFGPPPPHHDPKQMFEEADADGNDKLTLEEFKAHASKKAEEHFARMDRNGDGVITEDELPEFGPDGPGGPKGPKGPHGPGGPRGPGAADAHPPTK